MKRPFEDYRPLGPFAQSEKFRDRFITEPEDIRFDVGDEGVILLRPTTEFGFEQDDTELEKMAEYFFEELDEFIHLVIETAGSVDSDDGKDPFVVSYAVTGVTDSDLTVSQVRKALRDYVQEETVGAKVKMHHSRTVSSPLR